ncbi:NAD(P)-dependent dehydrogenase (short-subunit alcohol dehydrogenase family) [Jatrophihabitans sp. GAS493]|uniref:SDR family NAD(P)-dependent oxidoreductase n=1 Tax=Jatrophihabitans sp. GAS493 TaxID=1907575 RepID=UPI000BB97E8A|nr:SDR family NAD(P)-dependent oxidoreductase [Jatrophihabitans sp. GAS493]SOD72124.1 NAD(P)-dependent dehydrogenase (short-subunit alcohol dehydrogenase family) [Jatrophihabitans sp. GAS493]
MTEQLRFDGRVAIITGGGGGLGRAYSSLLASRGAKVVVNDIDVKIDLDDGQSTTPAARTVADIVAAGGDAVAHNASIADPGAGAALVQTALDAYGRVDIVINNAGILRDRSFGKMSDEEINDVFAVHLHGALQLTRAAWGHLREQQYGRVLVTTSVAGLFGNPGQANYASAKAAMVGLGRTLAIEGAKYGIGVNILSPGAATAMTAAMLPDNLHAAMSPDKVAPAVAYLVHESCSLSGEIIFATAGRFARDFIGETAGYTNPDATPEDIAAHIGEVLDTSNWTIPNDAVALPNS